MTPPPAAAGWWLAKPYRMVQTNLREIDAGLDLDACVAQLKRIHAEVLLFNTGGIVANYPTDLPYHFRNPHLRDDLVGKVLRRVHAEGIRFLARFDFSKVNEVIARDHPDWLFTGDGGPVNYQGQVHACVNGAYQQRHSIDILDEVLSRYPVDGVFFNMIGYQTHDYSGVDHGLCRCSNCRDRFRSFAGADLPAREDPADPVFRRYEAFRNGTCRELFHRIRDAIKRHGAGIAISTYTNEGVDIYRSESNSGIDRPAPEWTYASSDNVKVVHGSWPGMAAANTAVHFIDFPYRHIGVSPHLTRARLAGDLIAGGWVDWYVIGTLEGQHDRLAFEGAREVFSFHAEHEALLTGTRSASDLCLIRPAASGRLGAWAEYRGLYRILTESHVLFDVIEDGALAGPGLADRLGKYRAVVLPDARCLADGAVAALDGYVGDGGRLLATGGSATRDEHGNPRDGIALRCLGLGRVVAEEARNRGLYYRISPEDKQRLSGFADLDLLHLDTPFWLVEPAPGTAGLLSRVGPAMFGPPEKCYWTAEPGDPGVLVAASGRAAYLPWLPGAAYAKFAHPGFATLIGSVLRDRLGFVPRLVTGAPACVELALHERGDGGWRWLGLVNHPAQLGTAHHAPLPVRDLAFELADGGAVSSIRSLRLGTEMAPSVSGDRVSFVLPELRDFDVIVIEPARS